MARRKIADRNIRKISKTGGGSYYITVPIDVFRELKWRERQKVVITRRGDELIIKDWKN